MSRPGPSTPGAPGGGGTGTPPPATGADAGAPQPPIDGGSVILDGGAEPHDSSVARDCGSHLTTPLAADARSLWVQTNPVWLGQGYDPSDFVALQAETWAQGTPSSTPDSVAVAFGGDGVTATLSPEC